MFQAAVADLIPKRARFVGAAPAMRWPASPSLSWACSLAIAGLAALTHFAEAQTKPTKVPIEFNIPSQPLDRALEIYARVSSREVLYDGTLADGRRSSLVDGFYTPEVALQILLAGTGLVASFKDGDFFVVSQPAETSAPAAVGTRSAEHMRYYGRLQASLRAAFCASQVLPDDHRVAARLWIGQQGGILQARTLASTRNELDRQIEAILNRLRLGAPPPAGFAQPVTIVIQPSEASRDCDGNWLSPVVGP